MLKSKVAGQPDSFLWRKSWCNEKPRHRSLVMCRENQERSGHFISFHSIALKNRQVGILSPHRKTLQTNNERWLQDLQCSVPKNTIVIIFYSPSRLGQDTAKRVKDLLVFESSCHLSTTQQQRLHTVLFYC